MLRSSRLLAACAFLVGILLGASVCGASSTDPASATLQIAGSPSSEGP